MNIIYLLTQSAATAFRDALGWACWKKCASKSEERLAFEDDQSQYIQFQTAMTNLAICLKESGHMSEGSGTRSDSSPGGCRCQHHSARIIRLGFRRSGGRDRKPSNVVFDTWPPRHSSIITRSRRRQDNVSAHDIPSENAYHSDQRK